MRCPFLREAQVKFCRASAFRKMIVRLPGQLENERCSSPDYVNCPVAKQHYEERPSTDHCTFLQESLVQYCSAASVTKYVPYSESVLSQCGTESHKYCELYLALANPIAGETRERTTHENQSCDDTKEFVVDGIRVPGWLWYSPNHMWLDIGSDGVFHVGVDAFMAKTLGTLDSLTFVTTKGLHRPTVVLGLRGAELQMVFPNQMLIAKPNAYLRTNPSRIFNDPYTHGWLFEGELAKSPGTMKQDAVNNGLITGRAACEWMRHESERITQLVHKLNAQPRGQEAILMADGGGAHPGCMQHMNREELLCLFNDFFSPLTNWRKTL